MTTRRHIPVNMLALFLLTSGALAQSFWEAKDYRNWTEDEVNVMTSNSPWAKKVNDLTITWLSALPVKQALLKDRMDAGGVLAENAQEIMAEEDEYYAIAITGLLLERAEALREVSLKVPGKPLIKPAEGNFERRGPKVDVTVLFPRTNPIILEDKEVEILLKLGTDEIVGKFLLTDMIYKGKLTL